ncbi:ATP-binding cassette domain-containing protein [Hazenella sp. IB182353]|uniref:ABC transporter ATP-binding protein n=1 Tax=Polycladospora coralii TaxID=2771432 RepID=UPI001747CF55|nr:ATP-binding cassette domain-containing protein [Polycladospora coralii]MBS7530179.1 ATP-binding cassette domain-containing protein [Polycladospora coralii]
MTTLACKHVGFTYAGEEAAVLKDVSFSINEGEFVLLCGASGMGKTTLLRLIKRELCPAGQLAGTIFYGDKPLIDLPAAQAAAEIGMVFQHPDHQIVMDGCLQELAFGMENLGFSNHVMKRRIAETTAFLGIESWLSQDVQTLSGGQKQLLNLAAVLALRPKLLLLDEPTGMLDPIHARQFLDALKRINQDTEMTMIITEHRLEDVYPIASRVLILDQGSIGFDGSPIDSIQWMNAAGTTHRDWVPTVPAYALQLDPQLKSPPLTVNQGRRWLRKQINQLKEAPIELATAKAQVSKPFISIKRVHFGYHPEKGVFHHLHFQVSQFECVAIFGGNGSGKSTLLQIMAKLLKPKRGYVRYDKKRLQIGYIPQNPEAFFMHETVRDQIQAAVRSDEALLNDLVADFDLKQLYDRHPHDLSGGEMQKVALVTVLLQQPDVLLLDEPTKGVDPHTKKKMAKWMQYFIQKGRAIVCATHDIEFAAIVSTRCVLLFDRELVVSESPDVFFADNHYYTTVFARLTQGHDLNSAQLLKLKEMNHL